MATHSRSDGPGFALRDGLATVLGRLVPGAALRGLDKIYDWQPPT